MLAQLSNRYAYLLSIGLLVFALLFFGRRFWTRLRQNNPREKGNLVSNPGTLRILAILGTAFALIVFGFVLSSLFTNLIDR